MGETNGALYCTQCGRNIPASSRFCDQCGNPVRLPVQPVAQRQTARRCDGVQIGVILVVVVLFAGLGWFALVEWSAQGGNTNNSTGKVAPNPGDDASYCKSFPFDEKCPNHEQHKLPSVMNQDKNEHQDAILPAGQAGRDEFARRVNDTGQGVIRAHAKGETLIVESGAFDESVNRRRFRQLLLGGTGETYKDTDGKLCGLGFSELQLVGPTKAEDRLIPCG